MATTEQDYGRGRKESLWQQVVLALDKKDDDAVIALAKLLSDAGDSRGSYTLGYVMETKAKRASLASPGKSGGSFIDSENFILAAHWYTRAVSQGGGYAPRRGLARYYYYGLGGAYDFKLAYEYLKDCLECVSPTQTEAVVRIDIGACQIMMAELRFIGLGVPKDVEIARTLYSSAADIGYPAALIGLSRIAKEEKHYLQAILYFSRALRLAIKLVNENKDPPLLAGVGGKWQTFRRDWLKKE